MGLFRAQNQTLFRVLTDMCNYNYVWLSFRQVASIIGTTALLVSTNVYQNEVI